MDTSTLHRVLTILQKEYPKWKVPIVTLVAERSRDPFQVLISTVLSLRTKDEVTTEASRRLFAHATTPQAMLELSSEEIQEHIYPVGFYKTKAQNGRFRSILGLSNSGFADRECNYTWVSSVNPRSSEAVESTKIALTCSGV